MIISFIFFLILFAIVGILSTLKSQHTNSDYLLANQNIKPWLVALSAITTTMSGYMFIGMIGFTYTFGLSSIWLLIGWIVGDFLASTFIHKQLRLHTSKEKTLSFASILSQWNGTNYLVLRKLAGIISIIFLGTYAAAQFSASSKALHVLFNWDYSIGAIIAAFMVLLYCFSGGIRASIWTDAAQSFVMIFAMGLLAFVAIMNIGGIDKFIHSLYQVSPNYMNLFPSNLPIEGMTGPLLFVIGWLFSGFCVVGQPHIMIRFMAMESPTHMNRIRIYYYSWYTAFSILTVFAGLSARLLLPNIDQFDAELALPTLAQQLLPEILVGLILAGLFASTISTADSQILSCSAALTNDFSTSKKSYTLTKLASVLVTSLALFIALTGNQSVFNLVIISWSALGATFTPLIAVYALGGKPSEKIAISMMLTGLGTMLLWRYFNLSPIINEVASGIIAGLLPYLLSKALTKNSVINK